MSGKYALIIGNTEYSDPGLAQLTAPGKDAEGFARVLKAQDICAFDDVKVLVNQSSSFAIEAIDEFFNQKKSDDLLVLYFSGHGVRDELGALYLAVKNTNRFRLRSTALKSDFIREVMDQSRSKRQILILDCCNSGAFEQGTKAATGVSIGTATAFEAGYGRIILTASDSTQFAWEGNKVIGETDNSLFTHFLVKGLEGEADADGDGRITVDELYDYAYERVKFVTPKQTPSKFSSKQQGEIVLRESIHIKDIKPVSLPGELIDEIEDTRPYVREAAVQKLEKILNGKNIALALSARNALEKLAIDDNTTRRVSQMATQLLESIRQKEQKAEEERKAQEETERTAIVKAEEERLAVEKAEAERKAKEAKRLLNEQKAEEERIAKAKLVADRLAEKERIATEKAETEHKTTEEAQHLSTQTGKRESLASEKASVQPEANKKLSVKESKPVKRTWLISATLGVVAIALVLCGFAALNYLPGIFGISPATETPATEAPTEPAVTEPLAVEKPADPNVLPRNEILYFNGQQWGPVAGWNPFSNSMNNALAIAQQDSARVIMFETPYLYNMLDGKQYPLLADGDYAWNDAHTEITFKIKPAAKWSDGTPLIAEDVAYTWATHVKYNTPTAVANKDYIDTIEAKDDRTIVVKAKLGDDGKALNPLLVNAYLSTNYVIQKAWTQTLEERAGGDAAKLLADPAEDVVYSGPYHKFFANDTKVVYVRDDNYWGQDASMWGKLPAPKYLAHTIFADNKAGSLALKAGEVDVSQQFNANVQDLWLKDNLPISTYLPKAPYGIGASLPTAFYNLKSYGLDRVAVRKAIAMAVDYDTVIANAMTNQSATFDQVPRSLMNPTAGEQALYDKAAVKDLQWAGNDVEGAKALLDDAGIKDTDGDGWRELDGQKLSYVATCPNGWSDWQAAIEVVAAAGKDIGIEITTNYPEWSVYQTVVTNWPLPEEGYDIFMMWSDGAGPTQPWGRIRKLIGSEFAETMNNWDGNWGGYVNPRVDELLALIPGEPDHTMLVKYYTELTKIYLTDVPSFTLMYRPQAFHTVNESVWTNYPNADDGLNIPPLDLIDGYSIAGLYNLQLVNP